jgi:hypothetical protein
MELLYVMVESFEHCDCNGTWIWFLEGVKLCKLFKKWHVELFMFYKESMC